MIDRRVRVERGIVPALLALAAQLLFGAVAIQPALATVASSPLCVHTTHGPHDRPAPPAQAVSLLLAALAIPAPPHVPPPSLPPPDAGFTRIAPAIPQDTALHEQAPLPYRARGPPALS